MNDARPRLVVLGLDGLPFSLARSLCESGKLPNLSSLALSPKALPLNAELPELSPVNWASLVTGLNPGGHGVFGFSRPDPATYAQHLTDSSALAVPTILERFKEKNLFAKVINLPGAYPAKPMSGMLVAGFVAPDLAKAVYPPMLGAILAGQGYQLEADTTRQASDPDYLLSQVRATLRSRAKALELMWPDLAWDLFMLVLTETDRLFHFFYPAVANPEHALHGAFLEFLVEWDRLIGQVLERYQALPEPKRLMVVADHGFGPCETEFDLNVWLMGQGLLKLSTQGADEYDSRSITYPTAAFALDPGRIYINTKERFARGVFHEHVAVGLRREIKEGLMSVTWQGRPVMARVCEPQEIYCGPHLAKAPDLICQGAPGIGLTGKFNRGDMFGLHGRFGCHTADDAFFYDSLGSRPTSVSQAGAEIFAHFGLALEQAS
jgi:predicted AlkP superfamily phosphohydrolase/phosphomutase